MPELFIIRSSFPRTVSKRVEDDAPGELAHGCGFRADTAQAPRLMPPRLPRRGFIRFRRRMPVIHAICLMADVAYFQRTHVDAHRFSTHSSRLHFYPPRAVDATDDACVSELSSDQRHDLYIDGPVYHHRRST